MKLFRIKWYMTKNSNKFDADKAHEALADAESIFIMWCSLKKEWPHVEIYNMHGVLQQPEKGLLNGLTL